MVVRSSSAPGALAIDMRETAPAAASQVYSFPFCQTCLALELWRKKRKSDLEIRLLVCIY